MSIGDISLKDDYFCIHNYIIVLNLDTYLI